MIIKDSASMMGKNNQNSEDARPADIVKPACAGYEWNVRIDSSSGKGLGFCRSGGGFLKDPGQDDSRQIPL